jgi:hypothetical protein
MGLGPSQRIARAPVGLVGVPHGVVGVIAPREDHLAAPSEEPRNVGGEPIGPSHLVSELWARFRVAVVQVETPYGHTASECCDSAALRIAWGHGLGLLRRVMATPFRVL